MDSAQFHNIYSHTFISGYIEGGEIYGIISIKRINASKKSEVMDKSGRQFNGTKREE